MATREQQVQALKKDWAENPRWKGVTRNYTAEDVVRLRGSLQIEHTLAKRGAEKLWNLVNNEPFVNALGALTGNQAMQQVKAGLALLGVSGTPEDRQLITKLGLLEELASKIRPASGG